MSSSRKSMGIFLAVGLGLAVALVVLVAPRASSSPDGLEKVAIEEGFAEEGRDHALAGTPTADYGIAGLEHEGLATGLSGLVGIAITFGVAWGVLALVRRSHRPGSGGGPPEAAADGVRP